jgi:2-keto-4-pentenoate hydratase/2-oxohepta-3-ene-1,7-dioic acid hydratase in catechol pathway
VSAEEKCGGRRCSDAYFIASITASNDISSRKAQFAQSQWCYSKSFDGACPIGPAIVHKSQIQNLGQVSIEGKLDGEIVQQSGLE